MVISGVDFIFTAKLPPGESNEISLIVYQNILASQPVPIQYGASGVGNDTNVSIWLYF